MPIFCSHFRTFSAFTSKDVIELIRRIKSESNHTEKMNDFIERAESIKVSGISYELFLELDNLCQDYFSGTSSQTLCKIIQGFIGLEVEPKRISNMRRAVNRHEKRDLHMTKIYLEVSPTLNQSDIFSFLSITDF